MRAKILRERFSNLPNGYYAVSSDSAPFWQAKSIVGTRGFKFIGEQLFPGGYTGMYFQVTNSPTMRTVSNPPTDGLLGTTEMRMGDEDYSSILREYSDWKQKLWREVIQNAVDAGARNVRLSSTYNQERGGWVVVAEDDGVGMDQTTFTDVFLVLQASSKRIQGSNSVGGFGVAKRLIVLPWIEWNIKSRDREYRGVGRKAEIFSAPMRKGTRVELLMGASNGQYALGEDAIPVLKHSYYPYVNFTVDGKHVEADFRPERELFRVGDKAIAYFVPNATPDATNRYVVTARDGKNHGVLFMFSKWMDNKNMSGEIIVELTGPSKDLLTSNRDGFQSENRIEEEINRFIQKASADVNSAFRQQQNLIEKKFPGKGKFKINAAKRELFSIASYRTPLKETKSNRGAPAEKFEIDASVLKEIIKTMASQTQDDASEIGAIAPDAIAEYLDLRMTGTSDFENAMRLVAWRPDFYMIQEIPGYQVPSKFHPETMKPHQLKLAKVWAELIRFVLIQLNATSEYGVGWIFSKKDPSNNYGTRTEACFRYINGENWLLLNPFTSDDMDEMWKTSRQDHLDQLYALAIHEATHMVNDLDTHNEIFASALTKNMAKCAKGFRKLHAIVQGIRMKGDVDL